MSGAAALEFFHSVSRLQIDARDVFVSSPQSGRVSWRIVGAGANGDIILPGDARAKTGLARKRLAMIRQVFDMM